MKAVQLLREQLKSAHDTQEATMADVTDATAHFTDTNKALPVGAAYAHSVIGEDAVVATMIRGDNKLLSSDIPKTGLSEPMPSFDNFDKHDAWARSVKVDLPKLRAFAKAVYTSTDACLAALTESDLEKEVDLSSMGMGKQNLAFIINNFLILHIANLTGEMSAAKGFQGLKGYPF
ncbi:MAG: hypothetical protein Q8Q49_05145 [bacterium]|nr:hypothetical protein [bacterium]